MNPANLSGLCGFTSSFAVLCVGPGFETYFHNLIDEHAPRSEHSLCITFTLTATEYSRLLYPEISALHDRSRMRRSRRHLSR